MATTQPRPPKRGGSHSFSDEPTSDDRSVAAVVEVRDVASIDPRVVDLVGGTT